MGRCRVAARVLPGVSRVSLCTFLCLFGWSRDQVPTARLLCQS